MIRLGKILTTGLLALTVVFGLWRKYLPSYDEPSHNLKNWEVGKNGTPPQIHVNRYNKDFKILYTDYFKAIGVFFDFTNENGFSLIQYGNCFDQIFQPRYDNHKNLPCNAVFSEKGWPVKKLVRLIINDLDVGGCVDGQPKYIAFFINITSSKDEGLSDIFVKTFEPQLSMLEDNYKATQEFFRCE